MGFIKKLIGLFSKNKAESTVANEVEDNSTLLNEVEETTPAVEETPAVEGVVETKTDAKAKKVATSTVAKLVDFKAVAKEKYNANCIIIGAQVQAKGFYQKCGFKEYGDIFLEDGIDHIHMKMIL